MGGVVCKRQSHWHTAWLTLCCRSLSSTSDANQEAQKLINADALRIHTLIAVAMAAGASWSCFVFVFCFYQPFFLFLFFFFLRFPYQHAGSCVVCSHSLQIHRGEDARGQSGFSKSGGNDAFSVAVYCAGDVALQCASGRLSCHTTHLAPQHQLVSTASLPPPVHGRCPNMAWHRPHPLPAATGVTPGTILVT